MANLKPAKRDDMDDLDNDDLGVDEFDRPPQRRNPHSSASRWRHQESTAFRNAAHAQPREPEARSGVSDLADFLNSSRISPEEAKAQAGPSASKQKPAFTPVMVGAAEARKEISSSHTDDDKNKEKGGEMSEEEARKKQEEEEPPAPDGKDIACGPLINYRRMEGTRWIGSVLVVTRGGGKEEWRGKAPTLVLRRAGARNAAGGDITNGANAATNGQDSTNGASSDGTNIEGNCLYSDPRVTFWRFDLSVEIEREEIKWEYTFPGLRFRSKTKPQTSFFYVPSVNESFRIMFHSCNGFSVGTDEEAFSGACLWNDVMRCHERAPFHVMIGGGDQIYNDGIRIDGPLRKWTDISNPKKRQHYPFPNSLRSECDDYYLKNYLRWYSTEPFAQANGQIPQLNIWDDHDIIDGFGSYVNDFMKCDVFRGIGGTAHKYYMLFQHHLPPPKSTYTTDAPQTTDPNDPHGDPNQLSTSFVAEPIRESGYITGLKPGPYVAEHSHNMFARLGARMAFVGIDARTERTRHQVNYPETYDEIFKRLDEELSSAKDSGNPIRHLILLLGIPIAYPRLTWLENVFSSPMIAPIKFLNRRFGFGGSVFNTFDGSVDLLDDLDDHYTARTHKKERNTMIERFQEVCGRHSVRTTILGGDVHLAAVGRFYSKPKLNIPLENDHRYMPNIVSSAIVNKPPPAAIANLLARRNKIHHLNHDTDETLLYMFDKDPGDSSKTAAHNHVTMPSRNFAVITENSPNNASSETAAAATTTNGNLAPPTADGRPGSTSSAHPSAHSFSNKSDKTDGHYPLGPGESNAGTKHRAASSSTHGTLNDGSLDVAIRVEIDCGNAEGVTEPYGLSIPTLDYTPPAPGSSAGRASLRSRLRPGTAKSRASTAAQHERDVNQYLPPMNSDNFAIAGSVGDGSARPASKSVAA